METLPFEKPINEPPSNTETSHITTYSPSPHAPTPSPLGTMNSTPTSPAMNLLFSQDTLVAPVINSDLAASIHAPANQGENLTATPLPTPNCPTPSSTHTEEEQAILAHLELAEKNRAVTSYDGRNHSTTLPQFTPAPEGGFPRTHLSHSAHLFDFLDKDTLMAWFKVEHPKLLVRVFDHSGKDILEQAAIITERLRTNITIIANFVQQGTVNVRVSPPQPQGGRDAKLLPMSFLVHNISEETKDLLISNRIWSASDITFEARHFHCTHPPTLLFCLSGFTTTDCSAVRQAIIDVWAAEDNKAEMADILFSTQDFQEETVFEVVNTFTRTVYVERLDFKVTGGIAVPRYNVFAYSPTSKAEAWTNLRASVNYNVLYRAVQNCTVSQCHSLVPSVQSCTEPPRAYISLSIFGTVEQKESQPPIVKCQVINFTHYHLPLAGIELRTSKNKENSESTITTAPQGL
jgi:hypothetical protein